MEEKQSHTEAEGEGVEEGEHGHGAGQENVDHRRTASLDHLLTGPPL